MPVPITFNLYRENTLLRFLPWLLPIKVSKMSLSYVVREYIIVPISLPNLSARKLWGDRHTNLMNKLVAYTPYSGTNYISWRLIMRMDLLVLSEVAWSSHSLSKSWHKRAAERFTLLYLVHALAKCWRVVGNKTAKTLVKPHFLAALQILLVLTELCSLWRITNCPTFIWQPTITSLSLNGTAPVLIFLHFFSACVMPSPKTLSIISITWWSLLVIG